MKSEMENVEKFSSRLDLLKTRSYVQRARTSGIKHGIRVAWKGTIIQGTGWNFKWNATSDQGYTGSLEKTLDFVIKECPGYFHQPDSKQLEKPFNASASF